MQASLVGHKQIAEELIKLGANFDLTDKNAKTAMDIAKSQGKQEIFNILMKKSN